MAPKRFVFLSLRLSHLHMTDMAAGGVASVDTGVGRAGV
jgi:hypothetical protein